MAAHNLELHHAVPCCLLRLWDKANGSDEITGETIEASLEWEHEAMRWSVPVEISRPDLEELVERSTVVMGRSEHRLIHATDWQRWGRRGGLTVLRRYGTDWFSLLALKRWGRITAEGLDAARPLR